LNASASNGRSYKAAIFCARDTGSRNVTVSIAIRRKRLFTVF
jgi:hypothetical protein